MNNIFEVITDRIVSIIEAGTATGSISWAGQGGATGIPINMKTHNPYRGVNVLLLWATAQEKGFGSKYWLTFKQAKELGGHVRKGETATTGVFWGLRDIEETDEDGETVIRQAPFAKSFQVFNLDQVNGLTPPGVGMTSNNWDPHEATESLLRSSGARVIEGGHRACYSPSKDEIHMPDRMRFANAENFYAVALHELTHWTGHPSRCNRDLRNRFGSEAYAMEELVAELGATFLCADLGIHGKLEGHASYIQSWLRVLKSDKRAIISAAAKASQACDYLKPSEVALRTAA